MRDLTQLTPETDIKIKKVRSSYGELDIKVPQDRESFFDTKIVKKDKKIYQK